MSLSKKIARNLVFPALMKLKIDLLLQKLSRKSVLNVMYHGVVKENSNYFSPRHITADQFEKQLKYISKNFNVISLKEAIEIKKNKIKQKTKTLTISFDDGYLNNLTTALPLLEKYNLKTSFFISSILTTEMEIRTLWSDIIAAINYFYKNETIKVGNYQFKNLIEINTRIHLADFIKKSDATERDNLLKSLIETYDLKKKLNSIPDEVWKLMNKEDLQKFAESPIVEIGSHGHLHYNLALINTGDAINDMKKSKDLLESTLNQEIDMIAYPDGNYSEEIKDLAFKLGFRYQIAVNYLSTNDIKDSRIINRHGISSTTTFESNMINLSNSFKNKGI
jgi:peptidoglycan/xylan/chitin deacetylase (PgdA/CDA1 family)